MLNFDWAGRPPFEQGPPGLLGTAEGELSARLGLGQGADERQAALGQKSLAANGHLERGAGRAQPGGVERTLELEKIERRLVGAGRRIGRVVHSRTPSVRVTAMSI